MTSSGGFKLEGLVGHMTKRASISMLVPQSYFRNPWASPRGVRRT